MPADDATQGDGPRIGGQSNWTTSGPIDPLENGAAENQDGAPTRLKREVEPP